MRMSDLNLDVIEKAHAEDQQAYKRTKASPQHLHRAWLLKHVQKLEEEIAYWKDERDMWLHAWAKLKDVDVDDGVHSCHDNCQRPACVARREIHRDLNQ